MRNIEHIAWKAAKTLAVGPQVVGRWWCRKPIFCEHLRRGCRFPEPKKHVIHISSTLSAYAWEPLGWFMVRK